MSWPVDRSITVSAPKWTAVCSFSSSPSMSLVTAELPMLALIFVRAAMPMHIGSQPLLQVDLVGRNDHPPAGHLAADQFRVEPFVPGDAVHFGGHDARRLVRFGSWAGLVGSWPRVSGQWRPAACGLDRIIHAPTLARRSEG